MWKYFTLRIIHFVSALLISLTALPKMPDTLSLANVSVVLSPKAKDIVETEYLLLGKNLNYVNTMLEKMNIYLPTIESILQENNVPLDFKYLCVQESSLNASAVSSSNAVGFWQFKMETAKGMGLRVDQTIDERKHIIHSTRGAANYFLANNKKTNNWIGSLLSYRLGLGGYYQTKFAKEWSNKTLIHLDESTDWYVLRYLAHKLFWENAMRQFDSPVSMKIDFISAQNQSLKDLAEELNIDFTLLKQQNPWLNSDLIPADKNYQIVHIHPIQDNPPYNKEDLVASIDSNFLFKPQTKPKKQQNIISDEKEIRIYKVQPGDNLTTLARRFHMTLSQILDLNQLKPESILSIGQEIRYYRAIPVIELIQKEMDKVKSEPKKEFNKPISEDKIQLGQESKKQITIFENDQRRVSTSLDGEPVLIEPATSREIITRPADNKNTDWIHTEFPSSKSKPDSIDVNTEIKKDHIPVNHKVKQGETFYGIARFYGINAKELMNLNPIQYKNGLKIGDVLKLK